MPATSGWRRTSRPCCAPRSVSPEIGPSGSCWSGDGADRPRIEELLDRLALDNVILLPLQPRERMPAILASFDAAVVPLRKLDLFRGALPSKMFEAMASSLPVVFSGEGEASVLIKASGAGICVTPEDPAALAGAIADLAANPERARLMGEAGRRYVELHYDRRRIATEFETMALRLLHSGEIAT
jgi:glycosyltransferase involved in cell wall biosynthesis